MRAIVVLIMMFALTGCEGDADTARKPEDIIGIAISQSDMRRFSAYSYKLKEVDGEILFSCHYFDSDADFEEVTLEDVAVDAKYMDEMKSLVAEHGFVDMKYKKPSIFARQIMDAPSDYIELTWPMAENGQAGSNELSLNYWPAGANKVKQLFMDIKEAVLAKTGLTGGQKTPEDVSSVSVKCYSGMNPFSYYSFELYDDNGEILFNCSYYDETDEERILDNVPVDSAYMDELRQIVAEQGFLNMKPREPDVNIADAEIYELLLRWPVTKGGYTSSDSLRMTGYSPVTGADVVEKLFRDIAKSVFGEGDAADAASSENESENQEITYLSLECNHPMAGYGYNCWIEADASDGRILLSCDNYYDYAEKKVRLDRIAVNQSDMDRVREIAKEYDLVNVLKNEPGEQETRPDAPQYSMRICQQEDKDGNTPHLYVHYHPPGSDELLTLFEELAGRYTEIPATPR